MTLPDWRVLDALRSYRQLVEVLPEMSLGEVLRVLKLEAATRRRSCVLRRLERQAAKLNKRAFTASLQEKLHVKS